MAAPPGVAEDEGFIESVDRQRLFVRSWRPLGDLRAALAIVPGFHSHGAYYQRIAGVIASRGIAVHALDLRGRGKSAGARLHVRQFADYVSDVEALITTIRRREPPVPVFLLGHGAGAVVACLYALANRRNLAGLVCESAALEVPAPAAKVQLLGALALLFPRLPVLRLRNARFSRDERFVARMNDDPLIRGERQPARTLAGLIHAAMQVRASLAQLTLPLLVLHGSADTVTPPSASEFLHENAGSRDKTLQIFEGYYHDLINDRGHEHVLERIYEWMNARLSPAAHRAQIGISYINAGS